jgi:hypothetical protein
MDPQPAKTKKIPKRENLNSCLEMLMFSLEGWRLFLETESPSRGVSEKI